MKRLAVGLLACWAILSTNAAEAEWMTDFPKAQAKAKAENKQLLLNFTGSDWCPPCKALDKNVFSTDEFARYAKEKLVLVMVDFPRSKKQSREQEQANQALANRFNVEGFPTIVLLDANGRKLKSESGYAGQSAAKFIAELKSAS